MNITSLFKFYKKDGATILSMNKDLHKFVSTEEFQAFIDKTGFELIEMEKKDFLDPDSNQEVIIAPGLSRDNLLQLADIAVKTASNKILNGKSMVAALDCTNSLHKRIAIAF